MPAGSAPISMIKLDPRFTVGPLNRRLFGSFVEHLGRCVYTGIYEPDHPTADGYGFRADVAELITELGATIIRYPGGNFVSAYDWRDGIGPRAHRPVRYDLAWNTVETNQVGTDDFLQWCERLGLEPMMAVNLGTAGVREAVELLTYVNAKPGLMVSDERVGNGRETPYGVQVWCLGNEMDGPWQIGHKTPEEYGRLAAETARAMKRLAGDHQDRTGPAIELVACGSSMRSMPTFGSWERIVLESCFDDVEHISAHAYYEPIDGDVQSFLASAEDMDRFICGVVATADHVAAMRRSEKKITISFDEWNVWFAERHRDREPGAEVEDSYDVTEAVVVGSLLIELIRHSDRVAIACQAQLVNVLAPILTRAGGPAWRQTIFHPFSLTSKHSGPVVLAQSSMINTASMINTDSMINSGSMINSVPMINGESVLGNEAMINTDRYGPVSQLHSVSTYHPDSGELVIFAVNRGMESALEFRAELAGFERPGSATPATPLDPRAWSVVEHLMITDDDPHARNTEQQPDRVVPRPGNARVVDGTVLAELPAISWHCIRLAPTGVS